MKKPVKSKAFDDLPYRVIVWEMHDKCNYNCSFCGDEHKLGVVGWKDLDTYKSMIDSMVKAAGDKQLWLQLTGGEPTLYPKFIDLMKYMKEKGIRINLVSNASRTIRWWTQLRDAVEIDLLYLTFHSQQKADYKHVAEVLNLFLYEKTLTLNPITYVPESIDYAFEGLEYIMENTGAVIVTNGMDLGEDRITPEIIGEEKFSKLVNEYSLVMGNKIKEKVLPDIPLDQFPLMDHATVTYDDGSSETKKVTIMSKLGETYYEGWECYAGMDIMSINSKGIKFRGECRRDPTPADFENLKFFDEPFICDSTRCCVCALDLISTKIKK